MTDEEMLAAILIINEIEEKQKEQTEEVNQMVYLFVCKIKKEGRE